MLAGVVGKFWENTRSPNRWCTMYSLKIQIRKSHNEDGIDAYHSAFMQFD
jgi:hypothetical protein